MIVENGINLTIAIIVIICIVACAHYLGELLKVVREIRDTQRKISDKLGATTPQKWNS